MISPMNNHCSYLLAQEDSRWPLFLDILIIHGKYHVIICNLSVSSIFNVLIGPSRSSVVTESMSSILSGGNIDIADYIRNIFGLELTNQDITRRLETLHSRLGRHREYNVVTTVDLTYWTVSPPPRAIVSVLRRTCHIFVRPSMFNIEPYFHTTHTLYYLSTATSHYVTGTESQFTSRRIEAWYDNFGVCLPQCCTCNQLIVESTVAVRIDYEHRTESKWSLHQSHSSISATYVRRLHGPSNNISIQSFSVNYLGRTDQFGGATLTMVFYAQIAGHRAALRIETVGMHQDPHIAGSSLAVYRALFMPMFWAELIRKYSEFNSVKIFDGV